VIAAASDLSVRSNNYWPPQLARQGHDVKLLDEEAGYRRYRVELIA
jgi:hypothetical protein